MIRRASILWSFGPCYESEQFDGCSTRRRALLNFFEAQGELSCLNLASHGALWDFSILYSRAIAFLLNTAKFDQLILFYPDVPFFHPPHKLKALHFLTFLRVAKRACRQRGAELLVDVVDLPRWQAPCLGYTLRISASFLRKIEKEIFSAADRLILPSQSLLNLLAEDLSLNEGKMFVLPNGLPWEDHQDLQEVEGEPAFFYAGDLSLSRSRGIDELVDGFFKKAPEEAVLHLCGEGGDWLHGRAVVRDDHPKLVYHGHLDQRSCLSLARSCDFALIPYPEDDYFQVCFPSKLGLYISAGLPVLSTNLKETRKVLEEWKIGEARSFDNFSDFFASSIELLQRYDRQAIREQCKKWNWSRRVKAVYSSGVG